jgi:hypothetical protein
MRCVRLIGRIVLVLAFGLGLLVATADDSEVASLDLYRPATLLSLVTSRVRAVQSCVRDFRASDFIAAVTAGFRQRIRHESPTSPPVP